MVEDLQKGTHHEEGTHRAVHQEGIQEDMEESISSSSDDAGWIGHGRQGLYSYGDDRS